MTIEVKVVRVPGAAKDVFLEEGATVNDALTSAGFTVAAGEKVTLNGGDASMSDTLEDGDRVILAKAAKGA